MRDFNQSNRSDKRSGDRFGRRDFGSRFGGRDSEREMHSATCAECGNECKVPFRPSGDRPVYCSNCFEKRNNEDGNMRGSDKRRYGKPQYEERRTPSPAGSDMGNTSGQIVEQLRSLNAKLDKIISVLEPKVIKPHMIDPLGVETQMTEPNVKEPQIVETKVTELPVPEPKAKKPKVSKKKVTKEKPVLTA